MRKKVWVGMRCGNPVSVGLFLSTGTPSTLSHRGDRLKRRRANHLAKLFEADLKAKDVWVEMMVVR